MAQFGNDVMRCLPVGGSEFYLEGIVDSSLDRNSNIVSADTGRPHAAESTIGFQAPTFRIGTEDLSTIVAEVPRINGVCYATGATPGFQVYSNRHDRCSVNGRHATTNMTKTSALGHLLVDSIQGSAGSNVRISATAHALSSDGETDPIATAFNASLAAAPLTEEAWRIGGIMIAGDYIEAVTNVSINFNHQIQKPQHADFPYAKELDWQKASVTVSITVDDPEAVLQTPVAIGPFGLRITSASSYLQFRRCDTASTGGPDAPGNSTHIRCGLNGLLHVRTPYSASGAGTGTTQLEITTTENATGVPLVWLTGQVLNQS